MEGNPHYNGIERTKQNVQTKKSEFRSFRNTALSQVTIVSFDMNLLSPEDEFSSNYSLLVPDTNLPLLRFLILSSDSLPLKNSRSLPF